MASTVYNEYRAMHSSQYAYEIWKDYNNEKTYNITSEQYEALTEKYSEDLALWKRKMLKEQEEDSVVYDVDLDDIDLNKIDEKASEPAKTQNKIKHEQNEETLKDAKENKPDMETQEKLNKANEIGAGVSTASGVITGAAAVTTSVAEGATALTAGGIAIYGVQVSCYLSLAVGILYQPTRPNQNPRDSLMILQQLMQNQQGRLDDGQQNLETLGTEVASLSDDFASETDAKQAEIEAKEKLNQEALAVYLEIMQRYNDGEEISDSDKDLLEQCGLQIQQLGEEVNALKEEYTALKEDNQTYIEDQTNEYEDAADLLSESAETTSLAESYDEETKKMIGIQIAAQSVNAAIGFTFGGIATSIAATGFGAPVYAPAAAAALTGGALSLAGVAEQSTYFVNVDNEIKDRGETQGKVDNTTTSFNTSSDNWNAAKSTVASNDIKISDNLSHAANFEVQDIEVSSTEEKSSVETASADTSNPFAPAENTDDTRKNPFA